jgi:hypothetical protein
MQQFSPKKHFLIIEAVFNSAQELDVENKSADIQKETNSVSLLSANNSEYKNNTVILVKCRDIKFARNEMRNFVYSKYSGDNYNLSFNEEKSTITVKREVKENTSGWFTSTVITKFETVAIIFCSEITYFVSDKDKSDYIISDTAMYIPTPQRSNSYDALVCELKNFDIKKLRPIIQTD